MLSCKIHQSPFGFSSLLQKSVVAALSLALLLGCSGPSPEEITKQAEAHLSADNSSEAIRILQQAIVESPENRPLKTKLAEAYFRSGRHDRLFGYLESNALEPHDRAYYYFLLARSNQEEENWIRSMNYAKKGLLHADKNCFGWYFLLKEALSVAHAQIEEYRQSQSALLELISEWENLSCIDEKPIVDAIRVVGPVKSAEESGGAPFLLEGLTLAANIYETNVGVINEARQRLAIFDEGKSNIEERVESCMNDVQERYSRQWESVCSNRAERYERAMRVCINELLSRSIWGAWEAGAREREAADYCRDRLGTFDLSKYCQLPKETADILNARRSNALRDCQKVLDLFN